MPIYVYISKPKAETKMNPEPAGRKKKMVSKTHTDDDAVFILHFSHRIGLLLVLFHHVLVSAAFNFAAYASLFRVLMIYIMISFIGASITLLTAIILPTGKWHATLIRRWSLRISSAALLLAVFIIAWILFLEICRLAG